MHNLRILILALVFCHSLTLSTAQELVRSEVVGQVSQSELAVQFGPFGGLVENSVTLYKILYTTLDVKGVLDTASGLLILPDRPNNVMPLICVQHGTVSSKSDVPSNLQGGYELGLTFGALGYVTAMPDYLGLGESRGFHPYVHADSEASASLDMLLAIRAFATQNNIQLNDQLFITGYSQGGHASMALHREIELNQRDVFTTTAASHMSGPYSISGVFRDFIISEEEYFFPAYVAFTVLSYDEVYGLFDELEEVFKPAYANAIRLYYNGSINLTALNTLIIGQLTQDFGASVARNILQDSVITAIVNDPNHPFNVALRDNDVYEWVPEAPTRILYCMADDQVPFRNSIIADSVMTQLGATTVELFDVQSNADHGECVFPAVLNTVLFFGQFRNISTDVNNLAHPLSIQVFPNPTTGLLRISEVPTNALLQLYDLNGKLLRQEKTTDTSPILNLQNLDQGVYLLRITSDQGNWTEKILRQ